MEPLSMPLFRKACQIYLELAYPGGPESMPSRKRAFWNLPSELPIETILPPSPLSVGLVQRIPGPHPGYAFRLGCSHFSFMKLRVHQIEHPGSDGLVFSVDTHDAFSRERGQPPAGHPEADAWASLQLLNRELKEKIERAWIDLGILTLTGLLRQELQVAHT